MRIEADNFHAWDDYYASWTEAKPMGTHAAYRRAAGWVDVPGEGVEDWGGGTGYARRFFSRVASYTVVDGSYNSVADPLVVADIRTCSRTPDNILIRHVLEHNHNGDWVLILRNACGSFRHRAAIGLNKPYATETRRRLRSIRKSCYDEQEFARQDIAAVLGEFPEVFWADALVGTEQILYLTRDPGEITHLALMTSNGLATVA